MNRIALLTSCLTALLAAHAAIAAEGTINQTPAYQECSQLASTNPAAALAKAEDWMRIDNGIAAQHCRAMALYGLRRYDEAATALTAVRDAITPDNIGLRTYLARQISRAWINANRTDTAINVLSTQINDISQVKGDNATAAKLTSDLLLDRARIQVSYGKLDDATKDLDHAVSLTPINEDVLMERASVFEKLGDKPLARSDAEIVHKLNSGNSAAREMLQRLGGLPQTAVGLASPAASTPAVTQAAVAAEPASGEDVTAPKRTYTKRRYSKSYSKPKASTTANEAP